MIVGLKTQAQIVTDESTSIQNYAKLPFAFPVGSVLRALVEAHGRTAIWLESLTQFVLARTRLATSVGEYVDSFIADFDFYRAPGTQFTGILTFSSYSTSEERIVPVGAMAQTTNGLVTFQVIADPTNAYYSVADNGYVLSIGMASVNVSAVCTVVGAIGNVLANTVTLIVSPITGISNVSNTAAFVNGTDQQSDAAVKIAFVNYLNGLKRASIGALEYAISSVNGVTDYNLVENEDYVTDAESLGAFYAIIDDGTGVPPDSLVLSVMQNLEIYRGFTIRYEVHKPVIIPITITATVFLPAGYSRSTLEATLEVALTNYINSIPIGENVYYWRLGVVIGDTINSAVPAQYAPYINTTNILLNTGTSDISVDDKSKARVSSVVITLIS